MAEAGSPAGRGRRAVVVSLVAAGVLAVASACGAAASGITPGAGQSLAGAPGSSATGPVSSASSMPGMSMPGMSVPASGAAAAATPVSGTAVAIKNFAFSPAALMVKAGTTVTWTNDDTDAHTVTSTGSGGPLHSAALNTGQTYRYTFTKPGVYHYLCTIHPFMTATVTVTA